MAEIFFVRHGETDSNLRGLLHGRTDVPLTAVGEQQARRVAARLAEIGDMHALYTSPLRRAAATASAIGRVLNLPPLALPDLSEFDFGDFEGATLGNVQSEHPGIFIRIRDLSDDDFRFPNGESRREFHRRVQSVISDLLARHHRERIVVVAHGGVIGSAVAQLNGEDANDWQRFQVGNCSITHLELDGHTMRALHCWNDVAHLEVNAEAGGEG